MANKFDIKTKTFFQITPRPAKDNLSLLQDRVVFMEQGFDLTDIYHISECVQVGELWYRFTVTLNDYGKVLDFDFKRKTDCLMAQRELSRAWTRTGEFANEDVVPREGEDLQ